MAQALMLPTEEETSIALYFRDSQEPITIDAVDVENLILEVNSNKPEDMSFEEQFAYLFKCQFKRRLTKLAVKMICNARLQIINESKKNSFVPQDASGSTEPQTT